MSSCICSDQDWHKFDFDIFLNFTEGLRCKGSLLCLTQLLQRETSLVTSCSLSWMTSAFRKRRNICTLKEKNLL